jgi:hypothetical protein
MQTAIAHREAWVVKSHESRDRDLSCGWNPTVHGTIRLRFDPRRKRGADARSSVGVAKPAHLQIGERYKLCQATSAIVEFVGIGAQTERPKRQAYFARVKIDLVSVFGSES